jgi:GDPmannose 4,6-dehydratase
VPVALVTGITGQTGGYLAERLLVDGWDVHGIVRDADDAEKEFVDRSPQAVLHTGNLTDSVRMSQLVNELEPDAIFSLGGISSVAYSWAEPVETALVTGFGPVALLDAALQVRERLGRRVGFVQASSAEIFGDAATVPQNEDTPIAPVNPYGAAKAYVHALVGVYRGRGLEASSCILYNHESPRRPETFVTRKITAGAARIAHGLETELLLGNLSAVRDWGWAPDYADALYRAALGQPDNYVIATGQPHTVEDFVATAFAASGIEDWRAHVRLDPRFARPSDAAALVGDSSKARAALEWQPTVDFDGIVGAMVRHDMALLAG